MGHEADSPKDVGTSESRSAEETAKGDKEAGRQDTGPSGTSTARDVTGVSPQDPITRPPDQRSG